MFFEVVKSIYFREKDYNTGKEVRYETNRNDCESFRY